MRSCPGWRPVPPTCSASDPMPTLLHILNRPAESWVLELIENQRKEPANTVVVADLTGPRPDYAALVELVLKADSVQTW
jgi:hypothetical protein